MSALAARLLEGFADRFGGSPDLVARAPGRVNLIGEHTDYNDGFALPVAIGAETRVAIRARDSGPVRVAALDLDAEDAFELGDGAGRARTGDWRDYLRGAVDAVAREGAAPRPVDIAVAGDVPRGAGLSSSASLLVATVTGLLAAAGRDRGARERALLAQAVECDFVGVRCGNLDQLASAGGAAGAALLIDCRSLDLRPVPLPQGACLMIVQSGVARTLVAGAYNRRREQCEEAAHGLGVAALRDVDVPTLARREGALEPETFRRARHVVTENARVLAASEALRGGDLTELGRLMRESHASQRDDFGITVPETDRLAALMDAAIGGEGGARQTGGGFGGAVVGVMRADRASEVERRVREGYLTPTGEPPIVRIETAHAGASVEAGSA